MSKLRTPISYYGGKQKLAATIVKMLPTHKLYCEPFVGGAAIFFAKPPSECEVLNDTNAELINFYRVCKNRFHELQPLVRITLHSRKEHDDAWIVYNKPHLFNEVKRAWALWVLSTQSFCSQLDGSWGFDKTDNTTSVKVSNKREQFTEELAIRLQNAQIECADAVYIIQSRDGVDSFFYCDPPYYNSNCGHYDGYTIEDFELLLKTLAGIKGKFMLSSYPSDILKQYVKANGWHQWSTETGVSVNNRSGYQKRKVEVITTNYELK
jgi:DNA adenine methylase